MNKLLINFSMKNVAVTIMMIVMLFGGGLYAGVGLKIENMPNISIPILTITTTYPGSPQDVMEQITKPIETKISNIDGLRKLTSTSSDNVSSVVVELTENTDPEKKKTEIESLLQEITFPASSARPKVATIGFASYPSYYLVVHAKDGMTQTELDQLFQHKFKPTFEAISGYDRMDAIGSRQTNLSVKLNMDALAAFGLTPAQVSESLRTSMSSGPTGTVDIEGHSLMVRMNGEINSVYQLENIELPSGIGGTVRLNEIAKVEATTQSKFIARLYDKPAIGIHLYKMQSANAVNFSNEVDRLVEQWEAELPDIEFKTIFNTADEVKDSISGMLKEGIVGAVLAALTILLFLRNTRMTLIVLVSIPLSILITLLVMKYLNITLNIMTLGGIFIAIGRVVDDSIVVIENIFSRLQRAHERNESVIRLAAQEVASAITSSTLATVGVFAPIAMVSGEVGQLFRPFAITLSCAMLASLLVAVTVIPMLSKLLVLKSGSIKHHEHNEKGPVLTVYRRVLKWSLVHRAKTLLLSGLLFVVSIVATVPFLSVEFIPQNSSSRSFFFDIKLPYETSLQGTNAKVKELEEILTQAKDEDGNQLFLYTEALVGYEGTSEPQPYKAQIYTEASTSTNLNEIKKQYTEKMIAELPKGSTVETMTLSGEGGSVNFEYALKGNDLHQLKESAMLVKEKMKQFPELIEIQDTLEDSKMEVEIDIQHAKVKQYGLNADAIQAAVSQWLIEDSLGELKLDNQRYKTVIGLDKGQIDSLAKIGQIPIRVTETETVYLHDVAKVKQVEAPASIQRDNQEQVVRVKAKIEGQNKGGISNQVTAALNELKLPEGVSGKVGGVADEIDDSFSQLFVAMIFSVFIVYLIMVLAFGNASAPFAILFSLPLAVIGGLFGLLITNESVNVTSLLGFMMLIGIVVTNAIVLIDRAQQLRAEGFTVQDALIEAGLARFRPIIMTAAATIVALLPLALGFAKGTLISKGLAVVVIGGLTTSTILTLIVVPVVYEMLERFKNRFKNKPNKKKQLKDEMMKGAVSG